MSSDLLVDLRIPSSGICWGRQLAWRSERARLSRPFSCHMLPLVQSSPSFYKIVAYNLSILNNANRSVRRITINLSVTGVFKLRILHLVRQCQANRRFTAADNGINTLVRDLSRAKFLSIEAGIEKGVLNDLTLRMRMGIPEQAGLEVSDRSRLLPHDPLLPTQCSHTYHKVLSGLFS